MKISTLFLAVFVVAAQPAAAIDFNPFTSLKSMVETVAEDRSTADIAEDLRIKTAILADVIDKMGTDVASINSDVYEQDVLLTGVVETTAQKQQAATLTRAIEGVKKVYNEILVIAPTAQEKGAVEGFVDDAVIETKINALLLDGKGVNVTNFRWRSVGGKVFLFGRALSKEEHAKAGKIVKGIEGVSAVANLAKVKP
jgi:hyperosmotically inducible periplasmic protein